MLGRYPQLSSAIEVIVGFEYASFLGNAFCFSYLHKLTKIPIRLNTSFNIQGEPIVCSVEDAIKNFYLSGLDKMYIGDFEISK